MHREEPLPGEIRKGKRTLKLSNLDKVFWPDEGITKGDLIAYYRGGAGARPHLRDRPFTMKRYPDGWQGKHFFQKDAPSHMPEWIPTFSYRSTSRQTREKRTLRYPLVNDELALVWMANMGCIDMNTWYSRADKPDAARTGLFDLDLGRRRFPRSCVWPPRQGRASSALLVGLPKTSGSDGFHVLVPIQRRHTYGQTREFAEIVAGTLARLHPGLVTTEWAKAKRRGVLIDSNQNGEGKTIASSTRCARTPALRCRPRSAGRRSPKTSTRRPSRWRSSSAGRARRRSVRGRVGAEAGARPAARAHVGATRTGFLRKLQVAARRPPRAPGPFSSLGDRKAKVRPEARASSTGRRTTAVARPLPRWCGEVATSTWAVLPVREEVGGAHDLAALARRSGARSRPRSEDVRVEDHAHGLLVLRPGLAARDLRAEGPEVLDFDLVDPGRGSGAIAAATVGHVDEPVGFPAQAREEGLARGAYPVVERVDAAVRVAGVMVSCVRGDLAGVDFAAGFDAHALRSPDRGYFELK